MHINLIIDFENIWLRSHRQQLFTRAVIVSAVSLTNLIPVNDILIGMHLNTSYIAFFLHLLVTEASL